MALPVAMTVYGRRSAPQTVGDLLKQTLYLKSEAGVLVDPTVVKFSYLAPGSTTAVEKTYALADDDDDDLLRDSQGIYNINLSLTASGVYKIRWAVTGSYQGASEFLLTVADSAFD